ncbi:MAG: hypothetical protein HOH74_27825, partial [Gemmatimonadetes bacterium]|nr:hypothetical protein [Gemmatimonadota bacterium]
EHPVQDRDPGGCGWSDTDTRRGSGVAPFLSREGLVQALHPEEFAPEEKICGLGVRQWKHLDDTFAVILEVQHDREEEPFRRVWVGLFRAQEYSGVRELIARTRIHLRDDGEFSHFDLTPIRIAEDQYAFGLGSITRIPLAGGGGSFTTLDLFTLEQGDLRRVLSTVVESNMLMAGAWREDGSREHTEIEAAAVLSITANKRAGHYDLVKTLTFERTWELDEDGERILSDSSATPKRAVFGWTGSAYQSNDADPLADPLREMEIAEGLPVIAAQIEPYFSLHNEEGEMPWYEGYQRIGHPRASSALSPPGGPGYPIENICDYDPLTAWVEGDAGQGIGSRFAFTIWEDPVILENENEDPFSGRCFVANGYYKSQTIWSQNSRVRRLRVTLNGRNLCLIDLQDYRGIQSFTLRDFMRIKQDGEDKSHLPLIVNGDELAFEILSVYPGTKFEDTAISEFITDEILYSY